MVQANFKNVFLSVLFSPFTILNGKTLKIYTAKKEITQPEIESGKNKTDKKTFLKFACTNGYISITELQLEGKKRITIEEFLRGYRSSL